MPHFHLFHMSTPTVSRIVMTWINFMYLRLGVINIWPSREVVDTTLPENFKANTNQQELSLIAQK